jgi:predicted nuclease with TOPRIM domain
MDAKTLYSVLIIVGSFLSIGMLLNAFFLKGIYSDLGELKIAVAQIMENSKEKIRRIEDLERKTEELRADSESARQRLHSLEGGQDQLLAYLKSMS